MEEKEERRGAIYCELDVVVEDIDKNEYKTEKRSDSRKDALVHEVRCDEQLAQTPRSTTL